jgi:hypothetical protein
VSDKLHEDENESDRKKALDKLYEPFEAAMFEMLRSGTFALKIEDCSRRVREILDPPPDKLYKKPQAAELPEKHWSPHHDATHLTGNFRCCVNGVDMGDEWEIIVQPGHDYVFTAAPADAQPQTAPPAD